MKTARDLLREKGTQVYATSPDASVYDALQQMAEKNIGALIVFEGDRMVGLISERDYARKIVLKNKFSRETAVSEIMSRDVVTVAPDKNLEECMEVISEHRVRHLPVVEEDRVLGIISIGDVVKGIIDHKEFIIEQLEYYIKGWR
ncbi:MAG: CBS domain-containing protein [Desulfobacterales bacterium]|jgi:CBS domain-containing protein